MDQPISKRDSWTFVQVNDSCVVSHGSRVDRPFVSRRCQASWRNAENRFLKILKIGAITFPTFDGTLTDTFVGFDSLLFCEKELAVGIH